LTRPDQYEFCVRQAKLLRFFPTKAGTHEGRFFNLDIKKIESFWELRIWDKVLQHRNVRVMFAVFSRSREIWILGVYNKQTQKTPPYVKIRCRKRLRTLLRQGHKL